MQQLTVSVRIMDSANYEIPTRGIELSVPVNTPADLERELSRALDIVRTTLIEEPQTIPLPTVERTTTTETVEEEVARWEPLKPNTIFYPDPDCRISTQIFSDIVQIHLMRRGVWERVATFLLPEHIAICRRESAQKDPA